MRRRPRIAVVTGTRAEYGLLRRVIRSLRRRGVEPLLIVTGSHLAPEFGMSVHEIEEDGIPIAWRAEILLSSDTGSGTAKSVGVGVISFADAFVALKPDLLVILGDRFEILAAAVAATPLCIPIAHIAGGEVTEGAIDNSIRDAVTKLSHFHFVSTVQYRRRVIRMGEDPRRVFLVGATGVDGILGERPLSRPALMRTLGLPRRAGPIGVCTYHPVTLHADSGVREAEAMCRAMAAVPALHWVVTQSNADAGGRALFSLMHRVLASGSAQVTFVQSLGQRAYLSLLRHAAIMVGNSSSGILEAPYLRLPAVNLGDRQRGRLRASNVIDVPRVTTAAVVRAIRRGLSPAFRRRLFPIRSPYGRGGASEKIVRLLLRVPIGREALRKPHRGTRW